MYQHIMLQQLPWLVYQVSRVIGINVDTIDVNTINAQTINVNTIDVDTFNVDTLDVHTFNVPTHIIEGGRGLSNRFFCNFTWGLLYYIIPYTDL